MLSPDLYIFLYLICVLFFGMYSVVSFSYFLESPNSVLSYAAFDIPSIRPEAFVEPRNFGIHYFGDFLQPFDWGTLANPWTDIFPGANYPPLAIDFFKLFQIFQYKVAVSMYLLVMATATAIGSWFLLPNLRVPLRLLTCISLGIFSTPTLSALDRGNISGYLIPVVSLYLLALLKEKRMLLAISFGLLVAIKIWPLLLLVTAVSSSRLKPHLYGLAGACAYSLTSFLIRGGDFWETINGFVFSNIGFSGNNSNQIVLGLSLVIENSPIIEDGLSQSLIDSTPLLVAVLKFGVAGLLLISAFYMRFLNSVLSVLLALAAGVVGTGTLAPYAWFFAVPVMLVLLNSYASENSSVVVKMPWVLPLGLVAVLPNVIPIYHTTKGPSPILLALWVTLVAIQFWSWKLLISRSK